VFGDFSWMNSRRRVRMHLYNQGAPTNGPFRLNRYPRSRAAIRTAPGNRRYLQRPLSYGRARASSATKRRVRSPAARRSKAASR
jgi:hypothetical protein